MKLNLAFRAIGSAIASSAYLSKFTTLSAASIENRTSIKPPAMLHPTDFMHCVLSAHSYEDAISNGVLVPFRDIEYKEYDKHLSNWEIHTYIMDKKSGYYGVIYVNHGTKQVVLAHRGTKVTLDDLFKSDSSLKTDLKGILLDEIVPQQELAYSATKQAAEFAAKKNYALSITGHSLGAWHAEQSAYFCMVDFQVKGLSGVKTITFDSPGSKKTIESFKSNVLNKDVVATTDPTNLDIVTYLSRPNFVNSCNQHVGDIIQLNIDTTNPEILKSIKALLDKMPMGGELLKEQVLANKYILNGIMSVSGHSLIGILKKFDPETGKPMEGTVVKVMDWPCLEYKEKTMSTKEVKSLISSITGLNYYVKTAAELAIDLGESTTLAAALSNLRGILTGIPKAKQYWTTCKYIDDEIESITSTPNKENVVSSSTLDDTRQEFLLKYQGKYSPHPYNSHISLISEGKYSADYYLKIIDKFSIEALGEKLGWWSGIGKQIIQIKKSFNIKYDRHGEYIESKEYTIEELRNWIEVLAQQYHATHAGKSLSNVLSLTDTVHIPNEEAVSVSKLTSYIPYERNREFFGREYEMTQIDDKLLSRNKLFIVGMAGSGRRSVALEYAYREKDAGVETIWLKSDKEENIRVEYQKLAFRLGIRDLSLDEGALISLVNDRLHAQKSPILLILDNLGSYNDIKQYILNLPRNVKVLLITEDKDFTKQSDDFIELMPFSKDVAIQYLQKNLMLKNVKDSQLKTIYEKIGADSGVLPFHLVKVTGFINNELKNGEKIDNIIPNVEPDLEYLFDQINKHGLEWKLIQYLSYLDPDGITTDVLEKLLGKTKKEIDEAITKLKNFLEVSYIEDSKLGVLNKQVSIDRLSQDLLIKYCSKHHSVEGIIDIDELNHSLLIFFDTEFPDLEDNPNDKWEKASKLLSHVVVLAEKTYTNTELGLRKADLLYKLSKFYRIALCDYKLALNCGIEALAQVRKLYKEDHEGIAKSLNNMGMVYNLGGEYKKAFDNCSDALEMQRRLYTDDNKNTVIYLTNVGTLYKELGKFTEALDSCRDALEMQRRLHADGNTQIMATLLNNIGGVYEKFGHDREALTYYREALDIQQKLHTEDNVYIVKSLSNVGVVCNRLHMYKEALDHCNDALEMQRRLHIIDNLDTAILLSNVGLAYNGLGADNQRKSYEDSQRYYTNGLEYCRQAFEMQKSKLYLHNSTVIILNNMAQANLMLNKYDEASKNCIEGLIILEKLGTMNTLEYANILNKLAIVYYKSGDHNKCIELIKQDYLIFKKHNPNSLESKDAASILQKFAPEFLISGENRETIRKYGKFEDKALVIQRKIQVSILNKIHSLAANGRWSEVSWFFIDNGISGYLDEAYLKTEVGNDVQDIAIARMLIFEAMNIGVMSTPKKDLTCIRKFAQKYPELVKAIIKEHPEYFVDGYILREFNDIMDSDEQPLVSEAELIQLLGDSYSNPSGEGVDEHAEGLYHPYFTAYSKIGMVELLKLRLQTLDIKNDITVFTSNILFDGNISNTERLVTDIINTVYQTVNDSIILVPLNFYRKHWTGIIIEKHDGSIKISYIDPENAAIPTLLKNSLLETAQKYYLESAIEFTTIEVEKQKYNNCGPEVIEDFIFYLTGERLDQESVSVIHSMLLETSLLENNSIYETV